MILQAAIRGGWALVSPTLKIAVHRARTAARVKIWDSVDKLACMITQRRRAKSADSAATSTVHWSFVTPVS
jgi:hypothetical protein